MTLELVTIPCLSDNYAYLAHDAATGDTLVVDVPEAAPIVAELSARGWAATHVLLTHHHWDHVDGLADLRASFPELTVIGATADAHRLPPLDIAVKEGDALQFGGEAGDVYDVSGHTIGHIAVHFADSGLLFTADSLMALGCGRLFEGDGPMMHQSLSKLAVLPRDTVVCSGHEYTQSNANFAITVDPENSALISRIRDISDARAKGQPTVPSLLGLELDTNPFLRSHDAAIRAHLGMADATDAEVFSEIRRRKDNF